uniref:Candidate secreted effector n=1 Tax=Meloidogyne incognita TaxID=6306 RepID=A0A914LJ15_MELIC
MLPSLHILLTSQSACHPLHQREQLPFQQAEHHQEQSAYQSLQEQFEYLPFRQEPFGCLHRHSQQAPFGFHPSRRELSECRPFRQELSECRPSRRELSGCRPSLREQFECLPCRREQSGCRPSLRELSECHRQILPLQSECHRRLQP